MHHRLLITLYCLCGSLVMAEQKPLSFSTETFLNTFFRELCETTTSGYVLFGSKPVSIEGYLDPVREIPGTKEHYFSIQMRLAKKILPPLIRTPQKYIIHLTDHELLIINREKMFQAINENLLLFQRKFGIQITAKKLLDNLLNYNFKSLFQESETLQGILLGYGTQNALTYENGMLLRKSLSTNSDDSLPYQSSPKPATEEELLTKMKQSSFWKEIAEEMQDYSYRRNSVDDSLKIPFSFHKKSIETKKLFKEYTKSQKTVDSVLKTKNFTKQVIERLGGHLPTSSMIHLTKKDETQLPFIIARSIRDTFPEEFSSSFIDGMRAAKSGSNESKDFKFLEVLRRNYFDLTANRALQAIERETNVTCIIPRKLYLRLLKQGDSDQEFSFYHKNIKANFLFRDMENNLLGGTYRMAPSSEIQVDALIPAIAHGMLGMKIGEIRELFIHPQFLYGIEKSGAVKIKVELLELGTLLERENRLFLKPTDVCHISPDISSCAEYADLQNKYFYNCGLKTWMHYQSMVSLDAVLAEITKELKPLSVEQQYILLKLEWLLYAKQKSTI